MSLKVWSLKMSTLFFKNYVYLLADETSKEAALIDPVWDNKMIRQMLESHQLNLKSILLTHSHPDHIQLADSLSRTYHCPVYMHREEVEFYHFTCHNLIPFQSDETLKLGDIPIATLHTPGHTRGSCCFLAEDNLFCGDTLFIEGCGLCWGKGADPVQMYHSLQNLKNILNLTTKIFPGHQYGAKPGQSFQYVLANNIYLDFRDQESFVKYRMRKNQGLLFSFK